MSRVGWRILNTCTCMWLDVPHVPRHAACAACAACASHVQESRTRTHKRDSTKLRRCAPHLPGSGVEWYREAHLKHAALCVVVQAIVAAQRAGPAPLLRIKARSNHRSIFCSTVQRSRPSHLRVYVSTHYGDVRWATRTPIALLSRHDRTPIVFPGEILFSLNLPQSDSTATTFYEPERLT